MSNPIEITRLTGPIESIDQLYGLARVKRNNEREFVKNTFLKFSPLSIVIGNFLGNNHDGIKEKHSTYKILLTLGKSYTYKIFMTHPSGGSSLIKQDEDTNGEESKMKLKKEMRRLGFLDKGFEKMDAVNFLQVDEKESNSFDEKNFKNRKT